ncbi:MAG: transporter [Bacteroidales bacterium]|nr:transporter [Bacteroidales bacterium]
MSNRLSGFLRHWMLVISMSLGVGIFLILYLVPGLSAVEEGYSSVARRLQPVLVGVMLFLQFNVTAPSDIRLHRWHARLLAVQTLLFGLAALLTIVLTGGFHGSPAPGNCAAAALLAECAMLCFICPTAAASGVITSKIGGSLQQGMAYLLLSDLLASLLIPLIIPLVHPAEGMTYLQRLLVIGERVFSILVLPCALAWFIRYVFPGVQKWLSRFTGWAFYVWGVCLMLAMSLATRSLLLSRTPFWTAVLIALVALAACLLQFRLGRKAARRFGRVESITSGQVLGQKNTGFLIWLGLGYMTPVTSVAGGLYALWQNLVNSWELRQKNS